MRKLKITTQEGHEVTVTQDNAPELHDAYVLWLVAPEGSSREAHLWNRVTEEAGRYIDDYTADLNGEEIDTVSEAE